MRSVVCERTTVKWGGCGLDEGWVVHAWAGTVGLCTEDDEPKLGGSNLEHTAFPNLTAAITTRWLSRCKVWERVAAGEGGL